MIFLEAREQKKIPIALLLRADVNELEIEKEVDFIVLLHLTSIAYLDMHYRTLQKINRLHVTP